MTSISGAGASSVTSRTDHRLDPVAAGLLHRVIETPGGRITADALADHCGAGTSLQSSGLIEPDGFETTTTSLADHDDTPVSITWSADQGGYGYFSPASGWVPVPADRLGVFRVNFTNLLKHVLQQFDLPSHATPTTLLADSLWEVGEVRLPGRTKRVPLWVARRLDDPKVWASFLETVRLRPAPGLRVVLSFSPTARLPAQVLNGHAIISIQDVGHHQDGLVVDPEILAARVISGAVATDALIVMAADGASLTVRGHRYAFPGSKQRAIIRHLYEAWASGNAECSTTEVLEAADYSGSVNTIAKAFSGRTDWREFIKVEQGRCWLFA